MIIVLEIIEEPIEPPKPVVPKYWKRLLTDEDFDVYDDIIEIEMM